MTRIEKVLLLQGGFRQGRSLYSLETKKAPIDVKIYWCNY